MRVCIIIPAYNEGKVIRGVITDLKRTLRGKNHSFTVVVVDDGSKDNTAAEAKGAGAEVVRHILNTGQGGASATGLSYAEQNGFDLAATMDADGQHDPEDMLNGVKIAASGGVDLLIGSRLIDRKGMSRVKRIGNAGLSFVTFALFGVNVADSQSGMRVFSRAALEKLRWKSNRYEFCSEMLWRARQQGLRIDEYPIKTIYTEYSRSRSGIAGQSNWNGVNILKNLIRRRIVELFE